MVAVMETGVPALDEVLGGGIPERAMTIILGAPGAGKTILAEHIAVNQAKRGKRVVVFTALSESHDQLLGNPSNTLASFGQQVNRAALHLS